jgi:hypothetical protein
MINKFKIFKESLREVEEIAVTVNNTDLKKCLRYVYYAILEETERISFYHKPDDKLEKELRQLGFTVSYDAKKEVFNLEGW